MRLPFSKHTILSVLIAVILLTLLFILGETRVKTTLTEVAHYIPPAQTQTAAVSDFNGNLILHYTFDDGTATDQSGKGNNGVIVGEPVFTAGKIGSGGLSFTSHSQAVKVSSDLVGDQNVTLCAWSYLSSISFGGNLFSNFSEFNATIGTNNRIAVTSDGGPTSILSATNSLKSNIWQHICIVRDNAGLTSIYIDGVKSGSGSTGSPVNGYALRIGNRSILDAHWPGILDDVRIYNKTLSDAEILDIYTQNNTVVMSPPLSVEPPSPTVPQPVTTITSDSPDVTATSCSQVDIQQALNAAKNGAVVSVPEGTCTWSTTITIPGSKDITLRGAGVGKTVINGGTAILLRLSGSGRITRFTFTHLVENTGGTNGALQLSGAGWRVDGNSFDKGTPITTWGDGPGLIDHNTFIDGNAGINIVGSGDAAWSSTYNFGSGFAIYAEDNIFTYSDQRDGALDAYNGARYVFRHNAVSGTIVGHHGFDSGPWRGTQAYEIYNNTFINPNTHLYTAMEFRSGTGVVFDNHISSSGGGFDQVAILVNYRSSDNYTRAGGNNWDVCNGMSQYDGNTAGGQGYPCRDQIGRLTNQMLFPAYAWNNDYHGDQNNGMKGQPGGNMVVVNNWGGTRATTYHILHGRDFYNDVKMPGYTAFTYPFPLLSNGLLDTSRLSAASSVLLSSDTSPAVLRPTTLKGDFNHDGSVNTLDFSAMRVYWNQNNATYDLNSDGIVNSLDFSIMAQHWTG